MSSSLPHLRDLSHWQGPVAWRAERRLVAGVYLNVGQGMTFTDPLAQRRLRNATWAGLWKCGGYLFTVPGSGSGEAQADRLLNLAPTAPGRLRPCLDCESNPLGLNPQQLAAWFLGAVLRVRTRAGYYPTLYGPPSFLSSWVTIHPEVFGRCPLWLADYGLQRPPAPPAPWTSWAAWQWTDAYQDPNAGRVDDSFVADLAALTIPAGAKLRSWVVP